MDQLASILHFLEVVTWPLARNLEDKVFFQGKDDNKVETRVHL